MTLMHPALFAAGLACVAIPILIHLLMRRRRRPVPWAAMRFLLEAYRQQRRRLKLEQWLLLAARCALIALIAAAVARPLLGSAGIIGARQAVTLYLFVDNGIASGATDDAGAAALSRHVRLAGEMLAQLDASQGDRAGLVALGAPARPIVIPASTDLAAVAAALESLEPTDSATDIEGALAAWRALPDDARDARTVVAVLSDFLTGSAPLDARLSDATPHPGRLDLLASSPAPAGVDNVAVVGVEPLRPIVVVGAAPGDTALREIPVRIALRRTGPIVSRASATAVRLRVGAASAAVTPAGRVDVRWRPGEAEQTATATVAAPEGGEFRRGEALVIHAEIDADALPADNARVRLVRVRRALRVGVVAHRPGDAPSDLSRLDAGAWVRLALAPGSTGRIVDPGDDLEALALDPSTLDAARLAALDAVVLVRPDALDDGAWSRIADLMRSGGLLVVMPPSGVGVHLWPDAMVRALDLDWSIAREAVERAEGVRVSSERAALAAAVPAGLDLLTLVDLDLAELARAVTVRRSLPFLPPPGEGSAARPLLALEDGSALVVVSRPGDSASRGLIVYLATTLDFDWTDLHAKPLVVPLLQEIIRQGVGRAMGGWTTVAGAPVDTPPRTVELRPLLGARATTLAATGRGRTLDPVRVAGVWRAVDAAGATTGHVATDPDVAASRTDPQPTSAVGAWLARGVGSPEVQWIGPAGAAIGSGAEADAATALSRDEGPSIALPLFIAALLIALVELVMARVFSHAGVESPPEAAA